MRSNRLGRRGALKVFFLGGALWTGAQISPPHLHHLPNFPHFPHFPHSPISPISPFPPFPPFPTLPPFPPFPTFPPFVVNGNKKACWCSVYQPD